MIKKQMTMAGTFFGVLTGAASINVADRATAVVSHGAAVRVRIPGIPAWSPPDC